MSERTYADYVRDLIISMEEIAEFTRGMSLEAFSGDRKTVNAVIRSLEVLGEAAAKIPDSIRRNYPNIPWQKIIAMRNKLIHEYFGVDLEIVWGVATQELPGIHDEVSKLVKDSSDIV